MADVFRREYRALTDSQKQDIDLIKAQAQMLLERIQDACPPGPDVTIAQRKLEEAVFWAVKAATG